MIRGGYIFVLILTSVPAIVLFGASVYWWRQNGYKFSGTWRVVLTFIVLVGLSFINISSLTNRYYLRGLDVNDIDSIKIGERHFTESSDIKLIVESFATLEGWAPNHDPSPEILMTINLKSGDSNDYQIMYWQSEVYQDGKYVDGVVIDFYMRTGNGSFNQGGAFSEDLLHTFHSLGIELN